MCWSVPVFVAAPVITAVVLEIRHGHLGQWAGWKSQLHGTQLLHQFRGTLSLLFFSKFSRPRAMAVHVKHLPCMWLAQVRFPASVVIPEWRVRSNPWESLWIAAEIKQTKKYSSRCDLSMTEIHAGDVPAACIAWEALLPSTIFFMVLSLSSIIFPLGDFQRTPTNTSEELGLSNGAGATQTKSWGSPNAGCFWGSNSVPCVC